MDEIDSVLRLIRIDWEDTQNNDYNPLHLALRIQNSNSQISMSYNNIYHKVEQALSKVIELSFKGFSESLFAYKQTHRNTNESLEILTSLNVIIDEIKRSVSIDFARLEEKKNQIDVGEYLIEELESLAVFRDAMYIKNDDLNEQISKLVNAFRIIKDLKGVRPISTYISELDIRRKDVISKMAISVRKNIFLDDKLSFDSQLIFVLDCYEHLDKLIFKSSTKIISNKINKMITKIEEKQIKEKRQMLADSINNYLSTVIANYDSFMDKLDLYRNKKDNYFEKEMVDDMFFVRANFISFIREKILKLVDQCTMEGRILERQSFCLDEIEDTLDYERLLGNELVLSEGQEPDYEDDGGYCTMEWIDFRFIFYLYRNAFDELRPDLFEFLKHRYFSVSKDKITKKLDKILNEQYVFKAKDGMLKLTPKICKITDENCFFDSEFGYENLYKIYDNTFNTLYRNVNVLYKNKIVTSAFEDINKYNEINLFGVQNEGESAFHKTAFALFRKQVVVRRSDPLTLFITGENYKTGLACCRTNFILKEKFMAEKRKFEKIEPNPQLEELYARILIIEMIYKCALDFQIITDIVFLFDYFIKEGSFNDENTYLRQIIGIFKALHTIKYKNKRAIMELFETLERYIFSNLEKINVKGLDELKKFISNLKLLEEIICNFEMEYVAGFADIFSFFASIIEKNYDTNDKKDFAKKIGMLM